MHLNKYLNKTAICLSLFLVQLIPLHEEEGDIYFETSGSPKNMLDKPEDQNLQATSSETSRAVTLWSSVLLVNIDVSEEHAVSIFKAEVCMFRNGLEL
jgi:hypothetical protein